VLTGVGGIRGDRNPAGGGRSWQPARASMAAALLRLPGDRNKQDMYGSTLRSSGRCRLHLEVLHCDESTEVNAGRGGARLGSRTGGAA
jgi:hypothetical protein